MAVPEVWHGSHVALQVGLLQWFLYKGFPALIFKDLFFFDFLLSTQEIQDKHIFKDVFKKATSGCRRCQQGGDVMQEAFAGAACSKPLPGEYVLSSMWVGYMHASPTQHKNELQHLVAMIHLKSKKVG